MANRSFGPFVLILSVFATNLTAFYMIGIPAQAYRQGIGVWGMVGVAVGILTAVCIYVFGYRAWILGKKYGFVTQAEMFGARYDSQTYGIVMFIINVILLIPYIITSLVGAALALEVFTNGIVSYSAGTIILAVIVLLYTTFGGMRGTAYTNVLQGIIFLVVGVVSFFAISSAGGGLGGITQKLLTNHPELLQRAGVITVKEWITTMLLPPIAVVAFPHIFTRLLTGKNSKSIKRLCLSYPILYFVSYLPIVFIGVWGAVLIPGLQGKAADATAFGRDRIYCNISCYNVLNRCNVPHGEHFVHKRCTEKILS